MSLFRIHDYFDLANLLLSNQEADCNWIDCGCFREHTSNRDLNITQIPGYEMVVSNDSLCHVSNQSDGS